MADLVLLCTSAEKPVKKFDWLKKDVVVSSVSAHTSKSHEIEPLSLLDYQVFCDHRTIAPQFAGEMLLASQSGRWSPNQIVADITELIAAGNDEFKDRMRPKFFRSVGLGIDRRCYC